MIPPSVVSIRRRICQRNKCEHILDYSDPCVACPSGHFGKYAASLCKEPDRLGAATTAKNAAGAATRAVSAILKHERVTVSKGEQERRLAICEACEFYVKSKLGFMKCLKCGCIGKWKTKLATEHCPINKW